MRARDGAVKNGISRSSPRMAFGSVNLVPTGIVILPSGPGTIGPPSETSTTKICASISTRAKPGRSAGSADARISKRSMSFSGSNMGWPVKGFAVRKIRTVELHAASSRLRQRGLGLGERPVDPLRQQRDVGGFHRGAAPDPQACRRIAVIGEVITGAFLLHESHQLLGELGLRIRGQRGDRGIGEL